VGSGGGRRGGGCRGTAADGLDLNFQALPAP